MPALEATHRLYLLHFDPPLGKTRHYVGITRAGRVPQRLAEHARGVGAHLTRAALKNGSVITCVRLWPCNGFQLEQIVKQAGHYDRLCPICRRQPLADDVRDLPAVVARFPTTPAPPVPVLEF